MLFRSVVISIGASIGPILGGYFANGPWFSTLNYSLPYILAMVFALLTVISVTLFMRDESETQASIKNNFSELLRLFFDKKILKISLLLCLVQISWGSYYQFMPPVLKEMFHFSESQVGWFVGLVAVWLALASGFLVPFFSRTMSQKKIIHYCSLVLLLGFCVTFFAFIFNQANIARGFLWCGAVLIAASDVIIYAIIATLYSNAVNKDQQGAVMGVCFIVFSLVWALVALLGGFFSGVSVSLPIWLGAIGIVIVLLCGFVENNKLGEKT